MKETDASKSKKVKHLERIPDPSKGRNLFFTITGKVYLDELDTSQLS